MKLLEASAVLALMGSAAPALAQEAAFVRLDPNATTHVYAEGAVITPSSSIPRPQPQPGSGPAAAHTNVHIFQPAGMPANVSRNAVPAAVGPPFPGYYFETPESIACIYRFVSAVPGCNQHRYRRAARRQPDDCNRRRLRRSLRVGRPGNLQPSIRPAPAQSASGLCDVQRYPDRHAAPL
jgi:hypothetical protein